MDNQLPAVKRTLQWPVAKRKPWCDNFFCKTGSPMDLLALLVLDKAGKAKDLERYVVVAINSENKG